MRKIIQLLFRIVAAVVTMALLVPNLAFAASKADLPADCSSEPNANGGLNCLNDYPIIINLTNKNITQIRIHTWQDNDGSSADDSYVFYNLKSKYYDSHGMWLQKESAFGSKMMLIPLAYKTSIGDNVNGKPDVNGYLISTSGNGSPAFFDNSISSNALNAVVWSKKADGPAWTLGAMIVDPKDEKGTTAKCIAASVSDASKAEKEAYFQTGHWGFGTADRHYALGKMVIIFAPKPGDSSRYQVFLTSISANNSNPLLDKLDDLSNVERVDAMVKNKQLSWLVVDVLKSDDPKCALSK